MDGAITRTLVVEGVEVTAMRPIFLRVATNLISKDVRASDSLHLVL